MQAEINLIALVFIRCLGGFLFLPLYGLLRSAVVKLALALFCSALLLEQLETQVVVLSPLAIFSEIVLGIAIGLPLVFLIEMGKMWGSLFSTASGQNNAEIADPGVVSFSPALGVLIKNALWVGLVIGGAIPLVLTSLHYSFQQIPPASLQYHELLEFLTKLLTMLLSSLTNTMLYFAPFAFLLGTLDLSLGMLGRVFPRFNLSSESVALKSTLGFGLLFVVVSSGLMLTLSAEGLKLYASIARQIVE